jgi:hypothetical protein
MMFKIVMFQIKPVPDRGRVNISGKISPAITERKEPLSAAFQGEETLQQKRARIGIIHRGIGAPASGPARNFLKLNHAVPEAGAPVQGEGER